MDLQDALKKIEGNDEMKLKFYDNPQNQLQSMGVNTSDINIEPITDKADKIQSASVCVQVGEFVGVSVG